MTVSGLTTTSAARRSFHIRESMTKRDGRPATVIIDHGKFNAVDRSGGAGKMLLAFEVQ